MNKIVNNLTALPVALFRWTRVYVVPVIAIPYDYTTGVIAGIRNGLKSPK